MKKPKIDLTGHKYRMLSVVSFARTGADGHSVWNCVCDCGVAVQVAGNHLRKANGTASCGCAKRKHYESMSGGYTSMYRRWLSMRERCNNPLAKSYKHYGGRGIRVCPEWEDYLTFKRDMGDCPKGRSLDRIDNNGDYCKENCRWATVVEQAENTRAVRKIAFNGQTRTLSAWAREFGTNPGQVFYWMGKLGEQEGLRHLMLRGGARG